jgi:hypothetical protein
MGERKGLVTYIDPEYDPALVPKSKKRRGDGKNGAGGLREPVRLELPFSMQCTSCFEFLYKGRKYNAKKEVVGGETYLGMKILRFYIRCSRCSSQLTFKTDPKNSSYVCETGVTKNFEEWHANKAILDAAAAAAADESNTTDKMQELERKTDGNQYEMQVLDELSRRKDRGNRLDRAELGRNPEKVLLALGNHVTGQGQRQGQGHGQIEEGGERDIFNASGITARDEELLKTILFKNRGSGKYSDSDSWSDSGSDSGGDGVGVGQLRTSGLGQACISLSQPPLLPLPTAPLGSGPILVLKSRKRALATADAAAAPAAAAPAVAPVHVPVPVPVPVPARVRTGPPPPTPTAALGSLGLGLACYSSGSDEEDGDGDASPD